MIGSWNIKWWFSDDIFKIWLIHYPRDKYKAACKLRNNGSISALASQMNGKHHKSMVGDTDPLQSLFFKVYKPERDYEQSAALQMWYSSNLNDTLT